jgi:hypothetical protein
MKTLHVYGDSYCNSGSGAYPSDSYYTRPDWIQLLVTGRHKSNLRNFAVSGGSTENAMLKFMKDVEDDSFTSEDVIIFQTSTPGRLHFQFQNDRPETAAPYWFDVDVLDPKHTWYRQNQRYIKWYLQNFDNNINIINHSCYIQTISNFAKLRPDLTFVILQNTFQESPIPLPQSTKNCMIVPIELDTVSNNELRRPYTYNDWISSTRYDARVNHLSINNLNKLAELVSESLDTREINNFTYDVFEKRVFSPIRNKAEYNLYVERRMIYDRPWISESLC